MTPDGSVATGVRVLAVGPVDDAPAPDWMTVEPVSRGDSAVDVLTPGDGDSLTSGPVDCVVAAQRLPDCTGLDLLETVREIDADLPFLLFAADGDEDLASEAVAAGVTDYIPVADSRSLAGIADRIRERVADYRTECERRRDLEFGRTVRQLTPSVALVFDADGSLVWASDRARDYLGVDGRYLVGDADVYDEDGALVPPSERPARRVLETGESVSDWVCQVDLGGERRWFEIDATPVGDGDEVEHVAVTGEDVTDRERRERTLQRTASVFRNVYDVAGDRDRSFEEKRATLLDIGREYLGVELGFVTEISDTTQTIRAVRGSDGAVVEGRSCPLSHAYCKSAIEMGGLYATVDASESEAVATPAHETFGLETYVGCVIDVDGGRYGTVCFADPTAREAAFDDAELAFVELLSQWLGSELERKRRQAALEESRRRNRTVIDNFPNGAVVAFDDDLRYTVAGGEGLADVDATPADLEGELVSEALPAAIADVIEPNYRATVEGESRAFRLTYEGRVYRFRSIPLRDADGDVIGGVAFSQNVTQRVEHERELERRARQQAVVARLGEYALEGVALDDLFEQATSAVADALGHDYCKVLDLSADGDELRLRAGVGWDDGYVGEATVDADCNSQAGYTLLTEDPVVVEDLARETRFSGPDLLVDHDVTSGISVVVGPVDDPWGILGTHDTGRHEYADHDVTFVSSVATLLATAIDRAEHERTLRRQRQRLAALNDLDSLVHGISESVFELSSRAEIEELVCERLAESDSYRFAWIGALEDGEVRARTQSGGELSLHDVAITADGPSEEYCPTVRAHLTGEMQVVQDVDDDPRYGRWREHAHEHGYRASASIPVAHDADVHGTVNVYSDRTGAFGEEEREALRRLGSIIAHAIQSVERDRELDRERERLEFMNRLLRHDLLNSLNVVDARLEFLEGSVDGEVATHLETARARTRDMIDFVETIRGVMRVIGRGEQRQIDSVDLGSVLAFRVERARDAYPDATFELASAPDVAVEADDLLGEVLDNVLVNAVQHNDKDVPRVTVDAAVGDDEVVVSIADNGPGIPDDEKSAVLERGTTGFDNPDGGFGLFLVSEVLDSYGGAMTVLDNEPEGTILRLTFERSDPATGSEAQSDPGDPDRDPESIQSDAGD